MPIRRMGGTVVASALCASLWFTEAVAQSDGCDTLATVADAVLAERYAPVLWFGADERFFPTLPFFSAIDLKNRDDAPAITPSDIVPTNDSGDFEWSDLVDYYRAETAGGPPQGSVVYRVRRLDQEQSEDFWSVLTSYSQLRRSAGGALDDPDQCLVAADWVAIEYYFYYVDDEGLHGHDQDIEFVFVFVPRLADQNVAVVVGGAHSDREANNVAVYGSADLPPSEKVNVIVELGGHATSPDRRPYGVYTKGHDVNWYPSRAWGIRDIVGSSGLGFLGRYSGDDFGSRPPGVTPRLRFEGTVCPTDCSPSDGEYRLVSAESLETLHGLLRSDSAPTESIVQALVALRGGGDEGGGGLDPSMIPPMRAIAREARRVEEHFHYGASPVAIFKRWAFPPRIFQEGAAVPAGVMRDRGITFATVGTVVDPSRLTFDLFSIPGEVELSVGLALDRRSGDNRSEFFFARFLYQQEHVAWLTWHAGLTRRSYDRLRTDPSSPYRVLRAPRGQSRDTFLPAYEDSVFVKSDAPGEDHWANKDELDSAWSMLAGITLTPVFFPLKTVPAIASIGVRLRAGVDISMDLARAGWYGEASLSTQTRSTWVAYLATASGLAFFLSAKGWLGAASLGPE